MSAPLASQVMGELLKGSSSVRALPCSWACLRVPNCMRMCEGLKVASRNSTRFPCIAAGYCDPVAAGAINSATECSVAPGFRCMPERLCKRERVGMKMACVLKPGIGRWIGMTNTVSHHAAAVTAALVNQPYCGQPGAGAFCIAAPSGLGWVADMSCHVLTLGYGALQTVKAIETPGGDDDRQWLTFWLVLALMLNAERYTRGKIDMIQTRTRCCISHPCEPPSRPSPFRSSGSWPALRSAALRVSSVLRGQASLRRVARLPGRC